MSYDWLLVNNYRLYMKFKKMSVISSSYSYVKTFFIINKKINRNQTPHTLALTIPI